MDSAFKKLIYWSGHTHSLLGLAVHQLCIYRTIQVSLHMMIIFEYLFVLTLGTCSMDLQ